jgi:hypothetical protein
MKRSVMMGLLSISGIAFAKPGKLTHMHESYPDPGIKCVQLQGLWEGECTESGAMVAARLQVFQDGCTDLAFYDFDYPIPVHYKFGRINTTGNSPAFKSFHSSTFYSEWSEDQKAFSSKGYGSSQYTYSSKPVTNSVEFNFTAALNGEELLTEYESRLPNSTGPGSSYRLNCTYRKSR